MADTYSMEWPSGVGGVQCVDCERTTICRSFVYDVSRDETDWLCRPCREGYYDDDDFLSSDDSLGAASTTLNPPPGEHTGDR